MESLPFASPPADKPVLQNHFALTDWHIVQHVSTEHGHLE